MYITFLRMCKVYFSDVYDHMAFCKVLHLEKRDSRGWSSGCHRLFPMSHQTLVDIRSSLLPMLCLKEHSERRSNGKRLHDTPYWKAPCRSQRSCYIQRANLPSQGHWVLLILNCLNVHTKGWTHYCFSNGFRKNLKSSSQRVQIVSPSKRELIFLVDTWGPFCT